MPSVLILGATSSIARALAAEFARRKYDLILGGRDQQELSALASDTSLRWGVKSSVHEFDVLSFEPQAEGLRALLATAGNTLEGVILCVGYYGDQDRAQHDTAEAKRVIESNFTGCVLALSIVADHFERRRGGFICAVSSVAGDRGRRKNYVYGAAKAGLSAYLQGLRNRLFDANVNVITVKPGFVDTLMTYGRPGLSLVASPESVARSILRAIQHRKDVVYVPWFWRPVMFAVRSIPERFFKRLNF